ncbi:uncharacterized protein K02A2.6-like [Wyeomyia smithii]|uniref:uncharacterized protein K02A2.6-like n=1 Tax=Wyeomyia smithii TaxID=174621 RepID=UPI0024681B57|nr:uncharacterized protein K02A2.6-like [Wyeomyia smithii]XP_055523036.1 uncharacterized protein K02A2.6-like [Wyeomyia smithii]
MESVAIDTCELEKDSGNDYELRAIREITITLDNARQFASVKFESYCKQHGIHLNYSTPYWPQENGLVERQNRSLLKRLQISHALGRNWKDDLMDYLMMYYTSPHSTTGKTPTEMAFGRTIRSKIPSLGDIETLPVNDETRDRDHIMKEKGREWENAKRGARESGMHVGDKVLMKNLLPGNKFTTTFNPSEYVIVNKEGSRVTVQNKESGKTYLRNASHLNEFKTVISRRQHHHQLHLDTQNKMYQSHPLRHQNHRYLSNLNLSGHAEK